MLHTYVYNYYEIYKNICNRVSMIYFWMQFLMRNRAPSTSLPLPALEGFCNTSEMRLKVLQAHLEAMKEQGRFDTLAIPLNNSYTSLGQLCFPTIFILRMSCKFNHRNAQIVKSFTNIIFTCLKTSFVNCVSYKCT